MFKESNAPTLSSKRGFPRMKEKPPQAPPKEGMYSPKTLLSTEKGVSSYEREASPSPSEGGDVFPQNASFYLKEPLFHARRAFLRYEGEPPQAPPKEGMYSPQTLLSI